MRPPRKVFIAGDRVQLTAIGRDKLPQFGIETRAVVVEYKPGSGSVLLRLDGSKAAVSFPIAWWELATNLRTPEPAIDTVRQEERAAAAGGKGTPDGTPTPVETAPAASRAPLLVTCLTCLKQDPLELRDDRAPGPFVMPKCCGQWMQLLPLARSRPMPLFPSSKETIDMMRRMLTALACLLCLWPALASAQTNPITGYQLQYFNAGATQPLTQSDTIPAASVTCGVTPKIQATATNTINPTTAAWDDPASPTTADCRATLAAGSALLALPIGANYEGVVVAVSAGGNSGASNRAPFSSAPLPAARTGLRLTR